MTKSDILTFLRTHREELSEKFGVEKVALFGSYARGEEHADSDVDIAVRLKKKDFFVREDLREFLEKAFETTVDIGYLEGFRDYYQRKVEKDFIYV